MLPLSWYPDSTPEDIEKWKVPACLECNRRLGRIEEELLLRLGLCLDPGSIAALGISHKALRALNPQYAKNDRDRKIRKRKREKILQETIHFREPPKEGLLPHFGPQPGLIYHGFHAVLIAEDDLRAYAEKLVRGMSYVLDCHLLGDEYQIDLHVIKEESDQEAIKLFEGRSSVYHRGLGFLIMRMVRDDDRGWIYGFNIWRKLKFYTVAHPGDIGYLKQQSSSE